MVLDPIIVGMATTVAARIVSDAVLTEIKDQDKIIKPLKKLIKDVLGKNEEACALSLLDTSRDCPWDDQDRDAFSSVLKEQFLKDPDLAIILDRFNLEYQKLLDDALDNACKNDDLQIEGIARLRLGNIYFAQGRFNGAARMYQRSLIIFRQNNDRPYEGRAIMGIGNIRAKNGNFKEAIQMYESALDIFQNNDDDYAKVEALTNMGIAYRNQGRYDEAIRKYEDSLAIYHKWDTNSNEMIFYNKIKILLNIANVHYECGRLEDARSIYENNLPKIRNMNNKNELSEALVNMGAIYYELKQWERSTKYFEEYLSIRPIPKDISREGWILCNLGIGYYHQKCWDRAMKHFANSCDIFCRLNDPHAHGKVQMNMSYLYIKMNRTNDALIHSKLALQNLKLDSEEHKQVENLITILGDTIIHN
jgi:tetratricopeptide (TPR) repeat protein